MFYSPIFGICFQLPIICAEERIHITNQKDRTSPEICSIWIVTLSTSLRSRSIQYSLSPLAFGFCKKKLGASNYSVLVDVGKIKRSKILS